jgi:hypothetical protein
VLSLHHLHLPPERSFCRVHRTLLLSHLLLQSPRFRLKRSLRQIRQPPRLSSIRLYTTHRSLGLRNALRGILTRQGSCSLCLA